MNDTLKYPIGQQDFRTIRTEGYFYIDKTRFIETLLRGSSQYCFLARPPRFGKSLFLSTLQYFFEGERELFKGLYIDSLDAVWDCHPVLRLDLNNEMYALPGKFQDALNKTFSDWEEKYSVTPKDTNLPQRFETILKKAHESTGKRVVILVDEYNAPLEGYSKDSQAFDQFRNTLSSIYSNFKSNQEHIRFVFLMGVSKFHMLSVFSDINNIVDLTFDNRYADICGITANESLEYFQQGIYRLAHLLNIPFEVAVVQLKETYGGYRFAEKGSDTFNPWSLLNALDNYNISDYWNETGMLKIIAESLKKVNADLEETFDCYCSEWELKGLDLLNPNPISLLYQTGYLTIKEYFPEMQIYRLGIPNKEVKGCLFNIFPLITPR